ncbi:hypothetical protein NMG60_11031799 [Bertholletia excelsa]
MVIHLYCPHRQPRAAAASRVFILLLVIIATFNQTLGIMGDHIYHHRITASGGSSVRSLLDVRGNNQIVACGLFASKSQCLRYPNKCQWCSSEALDDMCFFKPEALRLPSQVFSCD